MDDPYESLILDCDFCDEAEHFEHRGKAVDAGWNWSELQYNDELKVQTVACPNHDADKVSKLQQQKIESITYTEKGNSSDSVKTDSNQATLEEA